MQEIYISRNHSIFEVQDQSVYLIDNNSLNGTRIYRKEFLSFVKVKNKINLKDEDIILIGNTSLKVIFKEIYQ
jgi:pSer/pThr/pTyr-binding forkhead associated (FHA) protein